MLNVSHFLCVSRIVLKPPEMYDNEKCLLLFQYKKPKEILTGEQELLKELKELRGTTEGDCKAQ